jgi:hypothetical protein
MKVKFKSIVEKINQKNNRCIFMIPDNQNIDNILSQYNQLSFMGHGVQSICFGYNNEYVIKCCMKRKHSIIYSKETFISKTRQLLDLHIPILPYTHILYDDDDWLIYTQPMCHIINSVSYKFCYIIIRFLRQMIENNIKISDIFYRNFGYYQNKILLFDYHDIDNFDSSSNFLVSNLYSIFTMLGKNYHWNIIESDDNIHHWREIVNDNFGLSRFPQQFVNVLSALSANNKNELYVCIDALILYIKDRLKHDYPSYKTLTIDDHDMIILDYPQYIYDMIFGLIQNDHLLNILDFHSTASGLGIKLSMDFPNASVTLICRSKNELDDTHHLLDSCTIHNAAVIQSDMTNSCLNNSHKYDLVIYNQVIFDLLRMGKLYDIFRLLRKYTHKFGFIEVPVLGDELLYDVSNNNLNVYTYFNTPFTICSYFLHNNIMVDRCIYINYNDSGKKRYLLMIRML